MSHDQSVFEKFAKPGTPKRFGVAVLAVAIAWGSPAVGVAQDESDDEPEIRGAVGESVTVTGSVSHA